MNRVVYICLLAFFGAVVSLPALGMTGDELLNQCSSGALTLDRASCEGYIIGVEEGVDTLTMSQRILHQDNNIYPQLFCGSRWTSRDSLVRVVVPYLRHHPESRHFGAASEVTLSLEQAYPCGVK